MRQLIELFAIFFKIGSVTFGGGYAMLPIIQLEIVEKRGWTTEEEMLDYYAIGQSTPGIIAVNTATFIGYYQKGTIGGIVATLGFVTPSIIIITIIATFFENFQDIVVVQNALAGVRVVVAALIINTVFNMFKDTVVDFVSVIIFIASFLILIFFDITPIFVIITSAMVGIIRYNYLQRQEVK